MIVTLKPHVGLHTKTRQSVLLDQDLVLVDGRHVGFVGRHAGAPVNFIERLTDSAKAAVVARITADRSAAPSHTSEPPAMVLPPPSEFEDES